MARETNLKETGFREYTIKASKKTGEYEVGALGIIEVTEPTLEELEFLKMVIERQIEIGKFPEQRLEARMDNPEHKRYL